MKSTSQAPYIVTAPLTTPLPGSLPEGAALDDARDLAQRFPSASLRKVLCLRASDLDLIADRSGDTRVWLAIESLQVTGSFKIRGALNAIAAMKKASPNGRVRIVAASAGNHGAGIAYAARVLGCEATVVVPKNAPMAKRQKIQEYGCTIVVSESPHYDDAENEAKALAKTSGAHFVSPYDDLDVVAGNGASLGYEIVKAIGHVPERVLVPFGGGGLASGMAASLAEQAHESLGDVRRVWGVQSDISPAMALSLTAGAAVERLECASSFADGLEGGISSPAFARARGAIGGIYVVPERWIMRAMGYAYASLGLVVEGSGAISIAPFFAGSGGAAGDDGCTLPAALRGGDLVCVLTGRNVDRARLTAALEAA